MGKKIALAFFIILVSGMTIHADDEPQQFEGFNLTGYSNNGQKSWDIKGETADIVGDLVKLTNIVANAYGDEKVNLTAHNGALDKVSGKMHLEKDVVITTETGSQLTTDTLDWDREKDLVTTKDFVKITNKDMVATGTGAEAHPGLKTAELKKDVTVEMKAQDSSGVPQEPVVITCDGPLEIDQLKQVATFNDNVHAVQTGREMKADKVEVFINPETKQIREMVATGHVSIMQGKNTTYSDQAIYTAADQKMKLLGRPKLIMFTEDKGSAPIGN
jgi:LPS export ABC transporter protein LptC/lipopolysaccharide transport protein LptA